MLHFLPSTLRGILTSLLIFINILFWCIPLFTITLARLLVPIEAWRRACARAAVWVAENWISVNNAIFDLFQNTRWEISSLDGLRPDDWYLVVANHQTWSDIFVLQRVFNRRIPFLKFFIKHEMIWFPIMGLAWWALDFPFMKRYSREYLRKHPEKRGEDLETTREMCARFQHDPVSIVNFMEGTCFSAAKHALQESPYDHLLRPKAGGTAFTLAAMNGRIRTMLNITIAYPAGTPTFWDFLCGKVPHIIIDVQALPIPRRYLVGSYADDTHYRERFQAWVRELWHAKDARLGKLLTTRDRISQQQM